MATSVILFPERYSRIPSRRYERRSVSRNLSGGDKVVMFQPDSSSGHKRAIPVALKDRSSPKNIVQILRTRGALYAAKDKRLALLAAGKQAACGGLQQLSFAQQNDLSLVPHDMQARDIAAVFDIG